MNISDSDERFFSIVDLVRIIRRHRRILWLTALGAAALLAFIAIMRPTAYQFHATFKERQDRAAMSVVEGFFNQMTGNHAKASGFETSIIMKSDRVLKPLIQCTGLQLSAVKKMDFWRKLCNSISAELSLPLQETDSFRFSDVVYEGENKLSFRLRFLDGERFEIFSLKASEPLATGVTGRPVHLPQCSFTLSQVPKNLNREKSIYLSLNPWTSVAAALRDNLQIVSSKTDRSLYDLYYRHSDRFYGAEILNELMQQYRLFLKADHDAIERDQLAFLEERQKNLHERLNNALEEYTQYLQSNLGSKGFLDLNHSILSFLEPYNELSSKLFAGQVEMEYLKEFEKRKSDLLLSNDDHVAAQAHEMNKAMGNLRSHKYILEDVMTLSGKQNSADQLRVFETTLKSPSHHRRKPADWPEQKEIRQIERQKRILLGEKVSLEESVAIWPGDCNLRELSQVRSELHAAEEALKQYEETGVWPENLQFASQMDEMAMNWSLHLASQKEGPEDLAHGLRHWIRRLSVREKILQERLFRGPAESSQLEGIDLETARKLMVETSNQLDASEASIRSYAYLDAKLSDPDFDLCAIQSILQDQVSNTISAKAIELDFRLKDELSHSEKEEERMKRELSLQHKMMKDHLQQLIEGEELKRSFHREKLTQLQHLCLDSINRQLSVYSEQIGDLSRQRKGMLKQEKIVLEKKMKELRADMGDLPSKWKYENLLKTQTEMSIKMMQSMAQIVEAKSIDLHLFQVSSRPIDLAFAPSLAQKPGIVSCSLLGSVASSLALFLFLFLRGLYAGFPVSAETLRALRYPFSGIVTSSGLPEAPLPESDLESLRRLILFCNDAPSAQVIGLIAGEGPDYSHFFADLMGQQGRKIVVVRADFSNSTQAPGLNEAMHGDVLPICHSKNYDWIPSGGATRFGTELLQSPSFVALITKLKASYDTVVIFSRASLKAAEAEALLKHCDKAAITVQEEPIELLTPFVRWGYHEGRRRLTILAGS